MVLAFLKDISVLKEKCVTMFVRCLWLPVN